jgi:hypothetical protein
VLQVDWLPYSGSAVSEQAQRRKQNDKRYNNPDNCREERRDSWHLRHEIDNDPSNEKGNDYGDEQADHGRFLLSLEVSVGSPLLHNGRRYVR